MLLVRFNPATPTRPVAAAGPRPLHAGGAVAIGWRYSRRSGHRGLQASGIETRGTVRSSAMSGASATHRMTSASAKAASGAGRLSMASPRSPHRPCAFGEESEGLGRGNDGRLGRWGSPLRGVTAVTLNLPHPDPFGIGPFCRFLRGRRLHAQPGVHALVADGRVRTSA